MLMLAELEARALLMMSTSNNLRRAMLKISTCEAVTASFVARSDFKVVFFELMSVAEAPAMVKDTSTL